jgi:imidazolonepropionase-like amidohydrolase
VLNGTSPFGWTLHNELMNLVDAGLSPAEALRAATELAAQKHQLADRGRIEPGMRADLVLLQPGANPLMNITDTRKIAKIWVGGFEYKDVASWNQSIYAL